MNEQVWQLIEWGLMIVLAIVMFWMGKRTAKPETIVSTLEEMAPLASEIATAAKIAVGAAEEFGRTGDIPQLPDEKLRYAINAFRKLPYMDSVDEETMLNAIHSFVPVFNALTPEKGNTKGVLPLE